MNPKHLLIPLAALCAAACGPRHSIEASFEGFTNDTVILQARPLAQYVDFTAEPDIRTDTLLLDGKRRIAVDLDASEPMVCVLMPREYAEAGTEKLRSLKKTENERRDFERRDFGQFR